MFVKLFLISAVLAVVHGVTPAYVTPGYAYAAPTAAPIYYTAAPKIVSAVAPSYSYPVAYAAPKVVAPAVAYSAPAVAVAHEEVDPNPSYSFSYGVSSPETGDHKSASESLVNGVVEGHYSLTEPDGSLRTVKYVADKVNGFNAVVETTGAKVVAAPVVKAVPTYHAPVVAHAPAYAHAPIVAHAPAYAHAPVVSYASPYSYIHKRATKPIVVKS